MKNALATKAPWRMLGSRMLLLVAGGLLALPAPAQSGASTAVKADPPPTWVELGESGAVIARQVLVPISNGQAPTCPAIQITGVTNPPTMMQSRGTPPKNFLAVCQAVIPTGATSATIGSISLPLPKASISNIVVVGDTGCKGDATGTGKKVTPLEEPDEEEEARAAKPFASSAKAKQDCSSHADWPLSTVAKHAAEGKPDLVIHVGDYVYVNDDNWDQWYAQFFKPARDLLLAAPWIFVRGNHEICKLHGKGFFYLLDSRSGTSCPSDQSDPYLVSASGSQFVVMDSSGAYCDFAPGEPGGCTQTDYNNEVAAWKTLFGEAKKLISSGDAFLLTHRPVWGIKSPKSTDTPGSDYCQAAKGRVLIAINSTLQSAYQAAGMTGIKMVVSGHIHNFQLITYDAGKKSGIDPLPQLVVGDSGVELSTPPPPSFKDCKLKAESGHLDLSTFRGEKEFGYGVLKSDATSFDLYLKKGDVGLKCSIERHKAECAAH